MAIRKLTICGIRHHSCVIAVEHHQVFTLNLCNRLVRLTLLENTECKPLAYISSLFLVDKTAHERKSLSLIEEGARKKRRLHTETCVVIVTDEELGLTLQVSE